MLKKKKKPSMALTGRSFSEETRRKLSEAKRGKNNPFYGKHHSEENKRRIKQVKL